MLGETVQAHERIQVEQSLKYSKPGATKLWNTASLKEVDQWMLGEEYGKLHTFLFISSTPFSRAPGSTVRHYFFRSARCWEILRHPTPSEIVNPLVIIPRSAELHQLSSLFRAIVTVPPAARFSASSSEQSRWLALIIRQCIHCFVLKKSCSLWQT